MTTKLMYRLWTAGPEPSEWHRRNVMASPKSRSWVLEKYQRQEPDTEHEMRPEMMEMSDEKPVFLRYAREEVSDE